MPHVLNLICWCLSFWIRCLCIIATRAWRTCPPSLLIFVIFFRNQKPPLYHRSKCHTHRYWIYASLHIWHLEFRCRLLQALIRWCFSFWIRCLCAIAARAWRAWAIWTYAELVCLQGPLIQSNLFFLTSSSLSPPSYYNIFMVNIYCISSHCD